MEIVENVVLHVRVSYRSRAACIQFCNADCSGFTQSPSYVWLRISVGLARVNWGIFLGTFLQLSWNCSSPYRKIGAHLQVSWSIVVYKWCASRKLLNVNNGPEWIVFFAVKYNSQPVKQIALLEFQPYVILN